MPQPSSHVSVTADGSGLRVPEEYAISSWMAMSPECAIFPRYTIMKLRSLLHLQNEIESLESKLTKIASATCAASVGQDDQIFSAAWFLKHSEEEDNVELKLMHRLRERLLQHSTRDAIL